ncbi:hypothetical protein [Lysobacter panacisoli]|uniref:Uncharacterized protein n=1 Tax=Lysobacter panacisoli TaxID=1255263 RepID=A0ABP9LF36_9GAMM|nr:hypothetical protein [Lysobacter panacisoli]
MRKMLIAAGGMLMAMSFQASAITKACYGCNSEQMADLAYHSTKEMLQQGPLYVVDLRNGVVRKYIYMNNWTPEWNPEFDPFEEWAAEVGVEAHISAAVSEVGGWMRAASEEVLHIPPNDPSLPSDIFQAIAESHFDSQINGFINNNSTADYWNEAYDRLERISGDYFNPSALHIYVRVYFSDGTNGLYRRDKVTKKWERIEGTERDSHGNKIPLSKIQAVAQVYVFETGMREPIGGNANDDLNDMMEHLSRMGVPIIDARGGASTGRTVMICYENYCSITVIQ